MNQCLQIDMVVMAFAVAQSAQAAIWTFQGLGDLDSGLFQSAAFDVSDDATAVVGSGFTVDNKAFHWTENNGMIEPENSSFYSHSSAISSDGSVAVGWVLDRETATAQVFRWTEASGAVFLGDLSGGTFESYANDVSANGNVIVGLGQSSSGYEAMRWTKTDGMIGLGDLPGGSFHSTAFGVSRDGTVIVGEANSAQGHEAFLWTSSTGMVGLGDLDGGTFDSHAEDVLDNGNVVIGHGYSALGKEAFRWTLAAGMVGLDDLPGGIFASEAWGGSADGSTVVGVGHTANGREAFIWDAANGMRNLKDVLISEHGVDLTAWTLFNALAMSADGNAIVGTGLNPDGQQEAWLAYALPMLIGDLNCDGFVGQDDLNIVLTNWGQNVKAGDWMLGDPTGDGSVGHDDLSRVLEKWGQNTPFTPLPELSSLSLLTIGALALFFSHEARNRNKFQGRNANALNGRRPAGGVAEQGSGSDQWRFGFGICFELRISCL